MEGRRETELERLDRNLTELMGELRVALPGIQVLFAFLLTMPFSSRFAEVSDFEEIVYAITLLLTAASAGVLIAPTARHRIVFRLDDKADVVFHASRLTIVGLGLLCLAMTGAVLLVTNFIFGTAVAAGLTSVTFLMLALLWYVAPLRRRAKVLRGEAPRTVLRD